MPKTLVSISSRMSPSGPSASRAKVDTSALLASSVVSAAVAAHRETTQVAEPLSLDLSRVRESDPNEKNQPKAS
ncbi:hypothetical protein [Streptomyces jumonjinensis]|uniref:hypothetical protein n=1 Tax=Streptomyces jumonjinensis TaxID=1945 RepID=UPI0037AECCC4